MNRSEKFWDRTAANFDNRDDSYDESYIQTITNYLHGGDIMLDFACGTGALSILLADRVKEIHATDISSKMLKIGKMKSADRDIGNISFVHATLLDEKFEKAAYDVVFACNILHLLPNPHEEIQRIYDLLKPGGIFISDTVCLGENRHFYLNILTILSKLRLIPFIKFFNTKELDRLIANRHFKILEAETLNNAPTSYLVIAEKV